jgi:DNA repair exonuclease SbcCD ATPase subunit
MDKIYKSILPLNNNKKLKPSKSFLSRDYQAKNKKYNLLNDNNNKINTELLKSKINEQKADIEYLENKLKDYDDAINEVTRLNLEINRMNEILKNKNQTILEYQNLSELSKTKFNNYLMRANSKRQIFEKNGENYDDLKSKNNYLTEQIKLMEKENNSLQHKLNTIKNKNLYDIDHLRNELDVINIEYEKEKKQNQLINQEKIMKNKEIIDLKTKLITCDKFKEEMNIINNKYNILEEQIKEKDKTIEELTKINNELKDKIQLSNENYNQVIYDQKNLESKINNLINKVRQYESIIEDVEIKNMDKTNNNNNNFMNLPNHNYNNYNNYGINEYNTDTNNYYISNYSRENNYYPIKNSYKYNLINNRNKNSKSPDYFIKRNDLYYNYNNI